MIAGLLLLGFGIGLAAKNRANLLYLFLILYPFDGSKISGVGIPVFQVMVYGIWAPLIFWLVYDSLLVKKKLLPNLPAILVNIGILYFYIFTRFLAATHPLRQSFFLVLTSGFLLACAVLYYYEQINLKTMTHIIKVLILIELGVIIQQAVFGNEVYHVLKIFDFSDFDYKMFASEEFYRGTGTFRDPNYYALFMAVACTFLMIEFSWLNAGFYLLGIAAIMLSFSRMGMILGVILTGILVIKFIHFQNRHKYLVLAVMLLGATLATCYLGNQFSAQLKATMETFYNAIAVRFFDFADFSEGGRGFIMATYFERILNLPNFFLGVGFLSFQMELERVVGINLLAHNEYLQIFADLGLVGVGLIGWVLLAFFKTGGEAGIGKNPYGFSVLVLLTGNLFLSTTLYVYVYFVYALYGAAILQSHRTAQLQSVGLPG